MQILKILGLSFSNIWSHCNCIVQLKIKSHEDKFLFALIIPNFKLDCRQCDQMLEKSSSIFPKVAQELPQQFLSKRYVF